MNDRTRTIVLPPLDLPPNTPDCTALVQIKHRNARLSIEESAALKQLAAQYPSRPLRPRTDKIRLLDIQPGQWSDSITCRLRTTRLSSHPKYEALSYTWGSSSEGRSITLHDKSDFEVTDNAYAALRRFRLEDSMRTIWIDALCINQGDLRERLQQVQMMGQIYERAEHCLIWLGEVPGSSPEAIHTSSLRPRDNNGDTRPLEALDWLYWNSRVLWWERAWIVQETVLSRVPVVCFASYQIPWGDFCWDFLRISSYERSERVGLDKYIAVNDSGRNFPIRRYMHDRFEDIKLMRYYYMRESLRQPLRSIYQSMSQATCSDSRDKIYSVLGIMDAAEADLILPDYTRPWQEVFTRATYASIKVQRCFDIFDVHCRNSNPHDVSTLPSWAVDFNTVIPTDTNISALRGLGRHYDNGELWHSWKIPPGQSEFTAQLSPNAERLTVKGSAFDKVVSRTTLYFTRPENHTQARLTSLLVDAVSDPKVPQAYEKVSQLQFMTKEPQLQPEYVNCGDFSDRIQMLRDCQEPMGFGADTEAFYSCSVHTFRMMKLKTASSQTAIAAAFDLWGRAAGLPLKLREQAALGYMEVSRYWQHTLFSSRDPALCTTASGFMGLAPSAVEVGDTIALFDGSRLPFVLRPSGEDWSFYGLAYLHGIMYDELKDLGRAESLVEQDFVLC